MQIKMLENVVVAGVNYERGRIYEISDAVAADLEKHGHAEFAAEPRNEMHDDDLIPGDETSDDETIDDETEDEISDDETIGDETDDKTLADETTTGDETAIDKTADSPAPARAHKKRARSARK